MTLAAKRDEERKETTIAVVASILIHLLLIAAIAFALTMPELLPLPEPPAEEEPLEVTLFTPEPATPPTPQFVRTDPNRAVAEQQVDAPFESDNNTVAASEAAPTGQDAMPSVEGRETPSLDLEDRQYTAGPETAAAPQTPAQQEPVPTPAPEPTAAPEEEPVRPVQLALLPAPPRRETPRPTPPAETQPVRQPQPPAAPGFQPETRVTRIRGNISNRGKASLQAQATPLGRYKKALADAIGSRWYYYVNNQIGLLNIGTVEIRFVVMPDGKVRDIKVLSNSSNESFASVSVSAIVEAEIPPIPEDVAKLLANGRIEIDYSFTILSN